LGTSLDILVLFLLFSSTIGALNHCLSTVL
jgi:hypothetical protein